MSKCNTFHFHLHETAKFPTIFIYKLVIIVLFTYLSCRNAVRINEIMPTKNLSFLEMGDIKMLLLSCHSHITCSLFQGLKVESKRNIVIHSEKYLMRFKFFFHV